ncbi:MAG: tetratricopeptide repeat protein [Candidatus Muiribacteriota bacterium]
MKNKKLYPDVLNNKGKTFLKQKKFSEAILCFKKAINMNKKFIEAYVNLGITYSDAGLNDQAVKAFTKASFLDPLYMNKYGVDLNKRSKRQDEIYIEEANTALKTSNFKKAQEYAEAAVKAKPVFPDYKVFLAEILMKQNKFEKARFHIEKALEINPSYEKAKEKLSLILYLKGLDYFKDGMDKEMLSLWKKALKIYPKSDLLKLSVNIEFTKVNMEARCPNCEVHSNAEFKFCPHCGFEKK